MKRFIQTFALLTPVLGILAVVQPSIPFGSQAMAANLPLEKALAERSIGKADAPVVIEEYASLTCSHCAKFHQEIYPKIKKTYIDTGKVRLVYHDFPFGGLALAAAMLARCAPEDKYFGLLEILYRDQKKWARGDSPRDELAKIVRYVGMSEDDFDNCLETEDLQKAIIDGSKAAEIELGVKSTPTFFINGVKVPNLPFEAFRELIDKALSEKKKI